MRFLILLVFVLSAFVATAELRPLSLKEISLMLRSGLSSKSILQEVEQRRVTEVLDPDTQKSLGEQGASPALLQALASGAYQVDRATAARAEAAAAATAAQREAEAEKTFRDATAALREQRVRAQTTAHPSLSSTLVSGLRDKLVRCENGNIEAADAGALESKKLIAFYFSAHWCAPCRKFTPALVDYYNRVAPQHPEFEIIFVSFDKSRFNWETYMREMKMPWPAIDFDQVSGFPVLRQLGGENIPSLLVLDEQSRIVASSYEGESYQGPEYALATLDKIFASAAAAAPAR